MDKIAARKIFLFFCMYLMQIGFLFAQDTATILSLYNPQNFYLPEFNPPVANEYRSANGSPGPLYWQNSADYIIHTTLSEKDTTISGYVEIAYTNNSPDKLDYLWLQLDQNLFNPKSRGAATIPASAFSIDIKGFARGGFHIAGVSISYQGETYKVQPVITDTRMQLRLNKPVLPKGDKITITVNYSFAVPAYGADRMGRTYVKKGVVYQIA